MTPQLALFDAQPSLPAELKSRTITTADGAQIYVRSGGSGPVVLLIHGFGDTGEMWGPVVRELDFNSGSSVFGGTSSCGR